MRRPETAFAPDEEIRGRAYDARLLRRLWAYVRPYRGLLAWSLVLLLGVSAAQLVQPYLVKVAIDAHITPRRLEGLGRLAVLFLAALAAEFVLRFAQLYVLEKTGQNVVYDLRTAVFAHLQRLPASYFDRHPVGRLMSRVTSDIDALNEAFTSGLVLILADLLKLAGIVAILLWMDWRLALVTLAVAPPMVGVTWYFGGQVRRAYRRVRAMVGRLNGFLQETVSGMRLVQMCSRESWARDAFREVNRQHRDASLQSVFYDSVFSAVVEMLGSVSVAAIVWAGGARILRGSISFGTLVAFFDYAEKFFRPLQEFSQRYATMQAAMASAERIFQLLDVEPEIVARPGAYRPARPPRGEIVFEGVTFGYEPGVPVLQDVSFRIRPGERVGVVGWTGSGKTTLIRLLIRLYDVWDGRILLDGVDVREYDLAALRRSVGVVFQDTFLFAGTVHYNLTLGDERVTRERVERALEVTGAEAFVRRLPGQLQSEVRERGGNFSTGEKQLLVFARALAFDPPVLALDEATSSVDPLTEARMQQALRALLAGRTSLVIAHRLATVRDADRILVLHHGRLREQGTHRELLRLESGIYRTLYTLQQAARGA